VIKSLGQPFTSLYTVPGFGPIQPPAQLVPGLLTPEAKQVGREAKHLYPSVAEVKNLWRNSLDLYPALLNGHDACFNTEINLYSKTFSDNETRHSLMVDDIE